jgi:hypothetical protein
MRAGIITKNVWFVGAVSIAVLMSAACAGPKNDGGEDARPAAAVQSDTMSREGRLAMRQRLKNAKPVENVSPEDLAPVSDGVLGEVPVDLLDRIFDDLEKQTGAHRSAFKVLKAEATQWNDGALGCPKPGQTYTQAIVDGYQVIIEHDGQSFDYHASAGGWFKLCAGFRPNR